jgi:hypothetical protein
MLRRLPAFAQPDSVTVAIPALPGMVQPAVQQHRPVVPSPSISPAHFRKKFTQPAYPAYRQAGGRQESENFIMKLFKQQV